MTLHFSAQLLWQASDPCPSELRPCPSTLAMLVSADICSKTGYSCFALTEVLLSESQALQASLGAGEHMHL
jgi:hypothetical protein